MLSEYELQGLGFVKVEKYETMYRYRDTPFIGHFKDGSFKFQLSEPITCFNDLYQITLLIDY